MSSAQGPDHGYSRRLGEQGRFREINIARDLRPTRHAGTTKNLPSATYTDGLGGKARSNSATHPWKLRHMGDGDYRVRPGMISNVMGEMSGQPLTEEPTIHIGDSGSLYWKIEIEPLVENRGTDLAPRYFISGGDVLSVEVQDSDAADTKATVDRDVGAVTNGIYYLQFAEVVNNRVIYNRRADLWAGLCDVAAEGVLSLWFAG